MAQPGIAEDRADGDAGDFRSFLRERFEIEPAEFARAESLSAETGEGVASVLVSLGLIGEAALAGAYADFLGIALIVRQAMPETPLHDETLNPRFLQNARVLPLKQSEEGIQLVMADPLDSYALEAIAFALGRPVIPCVAARSDVEEAIARLYGTRETGEEGLGELGELDGEFLSEDVGRLRDLASEAPVIRYVNGLIAQAMEQRASDIHIEPTESRLRVRIRVDGMLREVEPPPRGAGPAIISRIKIMAGLDIAERRLPQDGRIRLVIRGHAIDIRVSTSPTAYGESLVLRLLDREALVLDLASLGFSGGNLERFKAMLEEPHGIIAVTGPTGSGKTTTLYAALQLLNTDDRKILTIEDPIEYVIEGINQAQVKPEIGYTFAAALRSFLRQDPDVMLVGEIRDIETAEVAAQAALTGHLVLSTLHTNDAPGALTRLLDMGVEDFLLTATILGIVAQRLVRLLCTACREPYTPSADLVRRYDLKRHAGGGPLQLFHAKGCKVCGGTGYKGRIAIVEVLTMTEALSALLVARKDLSALRAQAVSDGMRPMFEDGLAKALMGVTTLEEILRVTRET
jgi:general secretion pathway protein E